jgi:hypothetical protein
VDGELDPFAQDIIIQARDVRGAVDRLLNSTNMVHNLKYWYKRSRVNIILKPSVLVTTGSEPIEYGQVKT